MPRDFGYIILQFACLNGQHRLELKETPARMRLRVLDEIRERLGLAYSPGVSLDYSDKYKGYGFLAVQAQTAPDKLPDLFAAIDRIAASLRKQRISTDELKRARQPMIESTRLSLNSNYWWLGQLTYLVDRPYYADDMLTAIRDLQAVSPADILTMARRYLIPSRAWKAQVLPQDDAVD